MRQIIGLTGDTSGGKDVVAKYLQEMHDFRVIVLSSFIRDEAASLGVLTPSTRNLQDLGNLMRQAYGADVLVCRALATTRSFPDEDIVLSGVRNLKEMATIHQVGGLVAAVVAPADMRFEWWKARRREGDEITREVFDQIDRRAHGKDESTNGQQVALCVEHADYTIRNNKGLEELYLHTEDLLDYYHKQSIEGGLKHKER